MWGYTEQTNFCMTVARSSAGLSSFKLQFFEYSIEFYALHYKTLYDLMLSVTSMFTINNYTFISKKVLIICLNDFLQTF